MLDQIDKSKFFGTNMRQSKYKNETYDIKKIGTNSVGGPEYLDEGDIVNFSSDNKYEMRKDKSIQRITGRNFNEKSIDG